MYKDKDKGNVKLIVSHILDVSFQDRKETVNIIRES